MTQTEEKKNITKHTWEKFVLFFDDKAHSLPDMKLEPQKATPSPQKDTD